MTDENELQRAMTSMEKQNAEMCHCDCHRNSGIMHFRACCRYSGIRRGDHTSMDRVDKMMEAMAKKNEEK